MSDNVKAVSDYRRRRKENLIKVCGSKCALCGYDKLPAGLEFHHIDPTQKSYGIASKGTCHAIDKDLAEVRKCLLICANCHREVHAGLYSQEILFENQYFDEEFANILLEETQAKTVKHFNYCVDCGKEIQPRSTRCVECEKKTRIIPLEEMPVTRDELKELIRTLPFTQIASKFLVSDNAIRKWCDKFNLPRKKTEIKQYSDEEWKQI